MSNIIYHLLEQVYQDEAQETYERIMGLINDYRSESMMADDAPLFSEQDVILITYGDTLQDDSETPLTTLKNFAVEHLKEAFSAIHILPFYPYSSDDGFSVKDYYAVDSMLGKWDDIARLRRHFRLMFDAVINHASAQGDWFRRYLAGEEGYARLFMTASPEDDLSGITRPRATPLLTPFTKTSGEVVHVWTTFSDDQVDFDPRHPQTLLRLLDVLLFYVEKGADIIRLDAIAYLWKEIGTTSIHLPQTHTIIQIMRAVLDQVAPQVILITETNVPHKENVSYFGDGTNEAQMVYNFTLPPLLLHTFLSGDAQRLREWINTLETPSHKTTFFNFTASHDGIGVRPVEGVLNDDQLRALIEHVEAMGGQVSYKKNSDGSVSPYELNVTYVDAMGRPDEDQSMTVRRFLCSQAIMLAMAGVPAVYIYSLLGSRNDLDGVGRTGRARSINRASLNKTQLVAELGDESHFRTSIFDAYRHLLKLRREQRAFHPNATQEAIATDNEGLFVLRRGQGDDTLIAIYNISDRTQPLPATLMKDVERFDIISASDCTHVESLAPYEFLWLRRAGLGAKT